MVRFYRLLLCLLFVSFNAAAYSGPKGLYTLEYPVNMPDVSVISENGMPIRIPSLRNDLTIMIFWSQSCFPCLREMKSLEKFYPKAAKDNIGVMLISPASEWKDNAEERKFLAKYGAPTLPFYNDENNRLSCDTFIYLAFLKPRHRFDPVHRHYEPQRQKSRNHSGRSRLEFRKTL